MEDYPLTLREAIHLYINEISCSAAPRTIEYYKDNLKKFLDYVQNNDGIPFVMDIYLSDVTRNHFISYIQWLREKKLKNVSINTYTRAVRVFSNWLADNGYIESSFANVKKLRDDSEIVYPLTDSQAGIITKYLSANPVFGSRNIAIFYLMLDCGLRLKEVIGLDISDIKKNSLLIRNSKYNKSRMVPLPYHVSYALDVVTDGRSSGPVFLTDAGERISKAAITKVFTNIKKNTGIYVHPHLLRHTFATSFVAGGGNLEILRILMGHADYNITQRYLHIAAQITITGENIYKLDKVFFKNYNNYKEEVVK